MNTQNPIEAEPVEIRSLSAAERSAWQVGMVREARTARDAALGRLLIRFALAMVRGVRTLHAPRPSRPRGSTHFYQ